MHLPRIVALGFGATLLTSSGLSFATSPSKPPCTEESCLAACRNVAANVPNLRSQAPSPSGTARCIEVSIEGKDDPCEFEKHPACDCEARAVPAGTQSLQQGLPGFAAFADAPDDACVTYGAVPGSCLLRGRDVRCNVGDDCKAVCDTWRTRVAEEPARAGRTRLKATTCVPEENACPCILEVADACFLGVRPKADPIACDTPPATAYRTWLDAERAKPIPESCNRGSCQAAPSNAPSHGGPALFAVSGLIALTLARAMRHLRG